jgi:hypothetical protein
MRRSAFTPGDQAAFAVDAKIGLLATLDPDRQPHVTLITSLAARTPTELMWGQFCEGASKDNLRARPQAAFLVLDQQKRAWRGTATWTREARSGEDHLEYNRKPLFRYNAYFGIHTVHYMQLREVEGPTPVSVPRLVAGWVHARGVAALARRREPERVMRPWAEGMFNRPDVLKFLAYRGQDGWPRLVPALPCASAGSGRLVLGRGAHDGDEVASLPNGAPVAVFALSLKLESVLVQGPLIPGRGLPGLRHGVVTITQVYNSMPPQQGLVYPRGPLEAATEWQGPGRAA